MPLLVLLLMLLLLGRTGTLPAWLPEVDEEPLENDDEGVEEDDDGVAAWLAGLLFLITSLG